MSAIGVGCRQLARVRALQDANEVLAGIIQAIQNIPIPERYTPNIAYYGMSDPSGIDLILKV